MNDLTDPPSETEFLAALVPPGVLRPSLEWRAPDGRVMSPIWLIKAIRTARGVTLEQAIGIVRAWKRTANDRHR